MENVYGAPYLSNKMIDDQPVTADQPWKYTTPKRVKVWKVIMRASLHFNFRQYQVVVDGSWYYCLESNLINGPSSYSVGNSSVSNLPLPLNSHIVHHSHLRASSSSSLLKISSAGRCRSLETDYKNTKSEFSNHRIHSFE